MVGKEMQINKIKTFLSSSAYDPPTKKMRPIGFNWQSIKHWASIEILKYVEEEKETEKSIDMILDDFIWMTDTYSMKAKNGDISFAFSVAKDVAVDVLNYVVS